MIQKIKLIVLSIAITGLGTAYGQVTVGAEIDPVKAALLEIKTQAPDANNVTSTKGGLGLPRVELVETETLQPFIETTDTEWNPTNQAATKTVHAGLVVYNLTENAAFTKGVYVWNGSRWQHLKSGAGKAEQYFYIPSFNIPLIDVGLTSEIDLYAEYVRQFTNDSYNPTFVSSNSAITKIPSKSANTLYAVGELDYVVTYYDADIIENVNVSAAGKLSYRVKSQITSNKSFLNVVFVIK